MGVLLAVQIFLSIVMVVPSQTRIQIGRGPTIQSPICPLHHSCHLKREKTSIVTIGNTIIVGSLPATLSMVEFLVKYETRNYIMSLISGNFKA